MTVAPDPIGWTAPLLKAYVDQRFLDSDKAVSAALQAAKEAVGKAEIATDKRFDSLADDADRRQQELSAQIAALQTSMHRGEGQSNTSQLFWSRILPILLSVLSVAVILYVALHK